MAPTTANGKICYVELPARDSDRSAAFYEAVFGWRIRRREDGRVAFDDGVEVSGSWVSGRPPSAVPGLLLYVMVESLPATIAAVLENGGELVVEPGRADAPEQVARVRDPAGNVIGLYQESS